MRDKKVGTMISNYVNKSKVLMVLDIRAEYAKNNDIYDELLDVKRVIEELPEQEIDAIPVDFIKEHMKTCLKTRRDNEAKCFEKLLKYWQIRNEWVTDHETKE